MPPKRRMFAAMIPAAGIIDMAFVIFSSNAPHTAEKPAALLARLVKAYPDHLKSFEGNTLIWKDGTRMAFDDGKGKKDFDTLLNAPDLEDQFYAPYPMGRKGLPPGVNMDPGRVRFEPFFKKIYGDCKKGEVARHMTTIVWLPKKKGQKIKVTAAAGVARQLEKVSADLDRLPKSFDKYLFPLGGIYNCRAIAGTKRYSVHAYGAAIDINTKFAHYWRWSKPDKQGRYPYKNQVPWEIIEIFEKHGFIWGGKWYHYDTMHFEYRPELLTN